MATAVATALDWKTLLEMLTAIYGILTLIVKFCPTLNQGILLEIIKILGKITNRQTNDDAVRSMRLLMQSKTPTK
jgi:hypothetical protein